MAQVIAAECFQGNEPKELKTFPESSELSQSWFVAAYLSIEYSYCKFQQLGYPEDVWLDTMSDMVIWLRHEQRDNKVVGLGPVARLWTAFLYNGKVIRRGRLECNTDGFFKGNDLVGADNKPLLAHGDAVINIHIPEDGALDLELCSCSLRDMAAFFAAYRKDHHWKAVICQSWLLDTQLADMLPESSNIIKFQKLGMHYPVEEAADTVFRIFGSQDPLSIEKPTLLQRKAAEFLRNNGVFREEGMVILRSKLEEVNFDLGKLTGSCK